MARIVLNRGLFAALAIVVATFVLTLKFYGPVMLVVPAYIFGMSAFVIWKFYGPPDEKKSAKNPAGATPEEKSKSRIKYKPGGAIRRALERSRNANTLSKNKSAGKAAEEDSVYLLYDGSEYDTREEYEAKLAIARKQLDELKERLKQENRIRRMKERG